MRAQGQQYQEQIHTWSEMKMEMDTREMTGYWNVNKQISME